MPGPRASARSPRVVAQIIVIKGGIHFTPDELNFDAGDYHDELVAMTECTFEEFVRTLVTHSYGGAARAGHS